MYSAVSSILKLLLPQLPAAVHRGSYRWHHYGFLIWPQATKDAQHDTVAIRPAWSGMCQGLEAAQLMSQGRRRRATNIIWKATGLEPSDATAGSEATGNRIPFEVLIRVLLCAKNMAEVVYDDVRSHGEPLSLSLCCRWFWSPWSRGQACSAGAKGVWFIDNVASLMVQSG